MREKNSFSTLSRGPNFFPILTMLQNVLDPPNVLNWAAIRATRPAIAPGIHSFPRLSWDPGNGGAPAGFILIFSDIPRVSYETLYYVTTRQLVPTPLAVKMSAHPKGHARTALLIFVLAVCSILFSFSTHGVGRYGLTARKSSLLQLLSRDMDMCARVQRGVKPASLAAHRLFARAPAGLERSVPHSLLRGIHRVAFKPSQGTPFSFSSRSRVQSEITTKSIVERAEEIANAIEIQDLESNNRRMLSTLSDEALEGKVVLLRADLNVPLAEDSEEVVDDQRIKDSIPTIQYLMKKGAKVLIIGHIERVSKTGEVKEVSMAPVAAKMSELLNEVVTFVSDCTGDRVKTVSQSMGEGSVALLENIRLGDSGKRDLENDPEFARELAGLADVYVLVLTQESNLNMQGHAFIYTHSPLSCPQTPLLTLVSRD
eukprot:132509-Amorphochlora_amoeboformis.AAC.1